MRPMARSVWHDAPHRDVTGAFTQIALPARSGSPPLQRVSANPIRPMPNRGRERPRTSPRSATATRWMDPAGRHAPVGETIRPGLATNDRSGHHSKGTIMRQTAPRITSTVLGLLALFMLGGHPRGEVVAQHRTPVRITKFYTGADKLSHAEEIQVKLTGEGSGTAFREVSEKSPRHQLQFPPQSADVLLRLSPGSASLLCVQPQRTRRFRVVGWNGRAALPGPHPGGRGLHRQGSHLERNRGRGPHRHVHCAGKVRSRT